MNKNEVINIKLVLFCLVLSYFTWSSISNYHFFFDARITKIILCALIFIGTIRDIVRLPFFLRVIKQVEGREKVLYGYYILLLFTYSGIYLYSIIKTFILS